MVAYDFLMLAILGGAVLWGLYKGMAWQVASIASLVVSYFVSMQLREQVASALGLQPHGIFRRSLPGRLRGNAVLHPPETEKRSALTDRDITKAQSP